MLRLIALRGVRSHKNVAHLQRRKNVIYPDRSRVVEVLLHLENKEIMPNHVDIQHKHMYSLYFGKVVCVMWPSLLYALPASGPHRCS